jgi:peptide deformylase
MEIVPKVIQRLSDDLVRKAEMLGASGLAATQLGLPYRVIVVNTGREYTTYVNPSIRLWGPDLEVGEEACLSIPDVIALVPRHSTVALDYVNISGEPKTEIFSGVTCVTIQHEIDHLDGILIIDRAESYLNPPDYVPPIEVRSDLV